MICITFDTDWVPQFVLDHVLQLLDEYSISCTFFCTSPYAFSKKTAHETALHPNLMSDSTQGNTERERLRTTKTLYPTAQSIRTHRLYWHAALPRLFLEHGIKYDSSLFCPLQSHLVPYADCGILRLPLWWADTFHIRSSFEAGRFIVPGFNAPGLKILLFHPLYIYLNTQNVTRTRSLLAHVRLQEASPEDLAPLQSAGMGVERLFIHTLQTLSSRDDVRMLKELA